MFRPQGPFFFFLLSYFQSIITYFAYSCNGISISTSASLAIDDTSVLSYTDDIWSCVCMDWWPPDKCDYGACSWHNNSILNVDLNNQLLKNAVNEFNGQLHLRLGGSLGDFVIYDIGDVEGYCRYDYGYFSQPTNETHAGYELFSGCLTMQRWDEINKFAIDNNIMIIFGIDALYGRTLPGPCADGTNCRYKETGKSFDPCCTNWTGYWDSFNAEKFMR